MSAIGELYVDIRANVSKLAQDIETGAEKAGSDAGEKAGGGFATSMTKMLGVIGGAAAVGTFLKGSMDLASDLNETVNKTTVVFGSASGEIMKWSETAATSFGLSKGAALDAASGFGSMFSQLGMGAGETAKNSQAVVKLAADLGSFNNLGTEDVLDKMSSAFRGEYDSIQAVLPAINGTAVAQKAMEMTGKKTTKQLNDQDKAQAVLALMTEQSALAQDDFSETSGGVANSSKIAKAKLDDFQAMVGGALTQAMGLALMGASKLIDIFTVLAKKVVEWKTPILIIVGVIGTVLLPLFITLGVQALLSAAKTVAAWAMQSAAAIANGVIMAITAGAIVLNWILMGVTAMAQAVVMAAAWLIALGPIGLIIAAVLAVVAIFVVLWKKMDGFKEFWINLWDTLVEWVSKAWEWIKDAFTTAVDFIKKIIQAYLDFWIGIWQGIFDFVAAIWQGIKDAINAVIEWIRTFTNNLIMDVRRYWEGLKAAVEAVWDGIKDKINGVIDWIKTFINNFVNDVKRYWQGIQDAVEAVWDGIVDAVKDAITKVVDKVTGLPGKVLDAIGNANDLLVGKGKDIVEGLWNGISSMAGWIKDKVLGFVKDVLPGPVEKALGISSPSKVFAGIGRNTVLGLREGIEDERGHLLRDMGNLVPTSSLAWNGGAAALGAPTVNVFIGDEPLTARMVTVQQTAANDMAGRLVGSGL